MIPETYIFILYALIGVLWVSCYYVMRKEKKAKKKELKDQQYRDEIRQAILEIKLSDEWCYN